MKKVFYFAVAGLLVFLGFTPETNEERMSRRRPSTIKWEHAVRHRYNLSSEQIRMLEKSTLDGPEYAIAAEISSLSGKPLNEIIELREMKRLGWINIAKMNGVDSRNVGSSVARVITYSSRISQG